MQPGEYERMYEQEDTYWWFVGRRKLISTLLEQRFGRRTDLMLLDIGCGTGAVAAELAWRGFIVPADSSAQALQYCRRRQLQHLCCADSVRLPFRDATFDAVVALDLLEHIEDDHAAAAEIHRVLRPSGCLFVTVPAYRFLWSGHDLALMHYRRYTASELRRLLTTAGLKPLRLSYAVTVLFPLVWLVRMRERRLKEPRSSVRPVPPWINRVLLATLELENAWLRHASLPFGVSVVAVAERSA